MRKSRCQSTWWTRDQISQAPAPQCTGACVCFISEGTKERPQLRLTSGHTRSTEMLQGPEAQAQVFVSLVTSRYRHRAMAPLSTFDVVARMQL